MSEKFQENKFVKPLGLSVVINLGSVYPKNTETDYADPLREFLKLSGKQVSLESIENINKIFEIKFLYDEDLKILQKQSD